MNERIKNLLMEAGLFCYDDGTVSLLGETHVGQPEIEKFAELIVRECSNRCYHLGRDSGPRTADLIRIRILAMIDNQK